MSVCKNCSDIGWVCESHPNVPWDGGGDECYGGAGMPCEWCNPSDKDNPPRMLDGFQIILDKNDGYRQ